MSKSYTTLLGETSERTEIRRSVFIATVAGIEDDEDAEKFVRAVRKRYSDATHNCYAYISDENGTAARFSDGGEPGGTAGQPILEVLKKKGLVKTVAVVTRYFGGIKLGAGGLVGAYTESVAKALDSAVTVRFTECVRMTVECGYQEYSAVENAFRKNRAVCESVSYADGVTATYFVDTDFAEKVRDAVAAVTGGAVVPSESGCGYAVIPD